MITLSPDRPFGDHRALCDGGCQGINPTICHSPIYGIWAKQGVFRDAIQPHTKPQRVISIMDDGPTYKRSKAVYLVVILSMVGY